MNIKAKLEEKERSKEELVKQYTQTHQQGQELGKQIVEIEAQINILKELMEENK